MNAQEKEILGVDSLSGIANLRDAVSDLLSRQKQREADEAKLKEQKDKSEQERERLRSELRKRDEAWRASVDSRLASQEKTMRAIRADLAALPTMMDAKIAACDARNGAKLEPAIVAAKRYADTVASAAMVHSYLGKRARWLVSSIGFVLFVGIAAALIEDRHDIAGALASVLAALAAAVMVAYGYSNQGGKR